MPQDVSDRLTTRTPKMEDAVGMTGERSDAAWQSLSAELEQFANDPRYADRVNHLLATLAARTVNSARYPQAFRTWREVGVHLTPVHFYSPIPDTRVLPEDLWTRESELPGLDLNVKTQLHLLNDVFPRFRDEYEKIAAAPTNVPHEFHLDNGRFDGTDALVLYCMIRHFHPKQIVEIGSGYSSRLAARAALTNGRTELVCVEPYPDDVLKAGFPGLARLIPRKVQDVDLATFGRLGANDILFIDSSHVVAAGSDVNYLFLEVLPRLAPGVIVHVHDIFLPVEYRREWVVDELRFWNEQYLLQAFLAFNSAFEVLIANSYLGIKHPDAMRATFPHSPWWGGGSFWMRRRA